MAHTNCNPILNAMFRQFLRGVFKFYAQVTIHHRDRIPDESVIFCSNHCSHIDGAAIYDGFNRKNRNISLVAAADYFFQFNYHALAQRLLPLIPIERDASLESVISFLSRAKDATINQQDSLIIFPEGRRSLEGELYSFKPGAAILSHVLGIPIVPLLLLGTTQALRKGHFLPRPYPIEIYVGEAIYPSKQVSFEKLHQHPDICQQHIEKVKQAIIALALEERALSMACRD